MKMPCGLKAILVLFTLFVMCFGLALPAAWGAIRFSGLDISEDNRLIFMAQSTGGDTDAHKALLYTRLPDTILRLLTVYPGRLELVDGGSSLLIHNAFGTQRLSLAGGLPQSYPGFPAFRGGFAPGLKSAAVSPDSKWLLYVEPTSYARGTLSLLDGTTGKAIAVSTGVERPGRFFPALWNSDSRGFIYAKNGRLYFYSIMTQSVIPQEQFRQVGEGSLNSFYWGNSGFSYYVRGSIVYRIRNTELFIRALYTDFMELGQAVGRLPFEFDPNFDNFWIAPDGLSILVCKGGRNLFYFPLDLRQETTAGYDTLPSVISSRPSAQIEVLWSADGIATMLFGARTASPLPYRLNTRAATKTFETLQAPPEANALLSPDGTRVIFWGKTGLYLYDFRSWKLLSKLADFNVLSCLWLGNNELVIGGEHRIERMRLNGNAQGETQLLCLSLVTNYGFENTTTSGATASGAANGTANIRRIAAQAGGAWYITDGASPWIPFHNPSVRQTAAVSPAYRVYLENASGFLENIPMVRNTTGVGTFPILEPRLFIPQSHPALQAQKQWFRVPDTESYIFSRGNRGSGEIAVCFDLYDDDAGLQIVLDTLERFNLKATFFINGEFIRRFPGPTRDIALMGHEAASMFYTPVDLSDIRYRTDISFIARGLARNEDEYFKTTGKELALFWHPPFYTASREIAEAAMSAGYRTIGRDVDPRDWIRLSDVNRLGLDQLSVPDMIDSIVDAAEGGSIIPIRLGALEGGRGDYLFNNLDVLLDAFISKGYKIVPVSSLLNQSRR